jgi:hypothetical protein
MNHVTRTKPLCGAGLLVLVAVMFSGCGEFAYKRGATASDLEAAKKSCREKDPPAKGTESATVDRCLADKGWVVQDLSKMEPIDADPVVEASAMPSDRRLENSAGSSPGNQGAERHASVQPGPVQPTTIVKRTPDTMDTFMVSSWWKTGSGADNLKSDTEACVAKLGEAHRPDNQTQRTTRGFLLCMKDKGWSGLRAR